MTTNFSISVFGLISPYLYKYIQCFVIKDKYLPNCCHRDDRIVEGVQILRDTVKIL